MSYFGSHQIRLSGPGSDDDFDVSGLVARGGVVQAVRVMSDTATTSSAATKKWTATLYNETTSKTIATGIDTDTAELVANDEFDMTLGSYLEIAKDDVVSLKFVEVDGGGAPTDLSGASIECVIDYV